MSVCLYATKFYLFSDIFVWVLNVKAVHLTFDQIYDFFLKNLTIVIFYEVMICIQKIFVTLDEYFFRWRIFLSAEFTTSPAFSTLKVTRVVQKCFLTCLCASMFKAR